MEQWIPLIAGIVIALIVLVALLKVLKTTVKTALLIAGILLALNFFGYGPGQLVAMLVETVQETTGG